MHEKDNKDEEFKEKPPELEQEVTGTTIHLNAPDALTLTEEQRKM